ncbi:MULTISPECIES: sensor histidine kinase [unclassified Microbacterium]|uniref:sensor histidine kinase n=1 Tax=unclassified Microbacterium TaxID=2609290 RepID=UPI000CFBCEA0|nr:MULTISPECIES: sensor histidine kinase [unclassified Microbacterium]PQZ59179.1 two-component sensor histidine kinase [Microbacterium sp. MYb43]PQZ81271.1 two-component sensor histidine kinase [Microbacterium sp. MYb40]PRB21725.1 two-component sensor histidine kinase [Microbacterium sp. MYb54]PRB31484.1 two-component sensor histidine kinase [Microbacterium sp. MYb50]PRB68362.1 two-component sensor histidine kinase [Microbacterium sp. MYb24]
MRESAPVADGGIRAVDLPRPPGVVRRFWGSHPWLVDGLLATVYLLLSAFWAVVTPLSSGVWSPLAPIVIPLILAVVGAIGLLVRRQRPWLTFGVFAVIAVVALATDTLAEPFGIALALYALFVYRSNRSGWLAFGVTVAAGILILPALDWLRRGDPDSALTSVPGSLLFLVVMLIAALLGVTVGDRRRYIGAILDRANQLARERDQQARIATLAERARITREIHDVVAHSVSVMVSLADGASALAEKDPQRSKSAIQEIGEVGRQSLVEMRQLLGALGDDSDDGEEQSPLRPNPGLSELTALVETFRTAGLPVTVRTDGTAPSSPALQNTIHRIVQESLTNALRYAKDPREVLVKLDFRGDVLVIEVTDDGRQGPPAPSVGSGRGLVGVRERARLAGGTVEAGPLAEGGWRVRVQIPEQEEQG